MSNGAKIAIAVAAALVLVLAGGGAFALTCANSSTPDHAVAAPNISSASPSASQAGIQTVPVSSAVNPFTPPVAQDAPDVFPVETQQPVEVRASSVGLYGGSRQINVYNKTKLINFLHQDPAMGRGWAQTIGISYSDIRTSCPHWVRQTLFTSVCMECSISTSSAHARAKFWRPELPGIATTGLYSVQISVSRCRCWCSRRCRLPCPDAALHLQAREYLLGVKIANNHGLAP